jgi:hypothetical protein
MLGTGISKRFASVGVAVLLFVALGVGVEFFLFADRPQFVGATGAADAPATLRRGAATAAAVGQPAVPRSGVVAGSLRLTAVGEV